MRFHHIGPLILSTLLALPSASALQGLTANDMVYATSFSNGCENILTTECKEHCAQHYKLTMMGDDCNGIRFVSQKTASDVAGCTSCPVLELDSTLSTSTCDKDSMGDTDIMFDGDQHQPVDKSSFTGSDGSYTLTFKSPDSNTCTCSIQFSETVPSSAAVISTTSCKSPPPPSPPPSIGNNTAAPSSAPSRVRGFILATLLALLVQL